MKSPLYWSGSFYHAGIKLVHGRSLDNRYNYIGSMLEDNVLDVGCGTGVLSDYLSKKDKYLGIDLNERFINFARKKGRNVLMQDALTFDRFHEFDVCVIMDLLHHITPRHEEFMERVLRDVRRRVIVCEPFEMPDRHPIMKNLIQIMDNDGTNTPEEWMDKAALQAFYAGFNPISVKEVGQAMIAVYEKV
jgi:2-polyprenyl-3-methyl-5-hydroxy-6-metoxy-1,4-benzoquinol methylase